MPGGRASGSAALRGMPLTEVPDEARLARAVMQTLGLPERPSLPQAEALYRGQDPCHGPRGARPLAVLDGCERLLRDCASMVRRLLWHRPAPVRHCPRPVR